MEKQKLGVLLIIFSIVFLGFIFYFNDNLYSRADDLGCNVNEECVQIEKSISITNIGFGFFGFMFGLGFFILLFDKDDKLAKRLDEDERFGIVLKALDDYEKKVLKAVREQDGITQSTLRLRTDMSKAKLSYVLKELEKRNLIKRSPKGKTLEVFLRI